MKRAATATGEPDRGVTTLGQRRAEARASSFPPFAFDRRGWLPRRPYVAMVGVGLALAGQYFVAGRRDMETGAGLLALGALLFAGACWRLDSREEAAVPTEERATPAPGPRELAAGFFPAIVLNAVALALFAIEARPNAAWLAWVFSVALAAVDGWRVFGKARPRLWPTREVLLVLLLTAIGAGFRLYRLDELPPGLWSDEGAVGLEVMRVLRDPEYRPIFAGSPLHSPFLWFYWSAASVYLLGPTAEALRLPAIVGGILYVPIVYALGRQLLGPRAAVAAAAIAAGLLWNVNFSRHGWTYDIWTIALDALAVTLLARAIQSRRPGSALAGGLVWGLALQGYQPARLLVLVLGSFLLLVALHERRRFFQRHALSLALFAMGSILAASPILLFATLRPSEYTFRQQQVFIGHEVQRAGRLDPLFENVRRHLLMFNVAGDRNGRHNVPGAPMLDQVTGALFVVGLGLAMSRLRRPVWALLPIWVLVGLAGGILTLGFEAPQALRGIEAQTPAILLAGASLGALVGVADRSGRPIDRFLASTLIGALLVVAIGLNFHAYFIRKAGDFAAWAAYSTAETIAAHRAGPLAATHNVYLDDTWIGHPTVRFLAPGLGDTRRLDLAGNIPLRDARSVAIFLSGAHDAPIEDLRSLYPDAQFEEIAPPFGGPAVVRSALIPSAAIEAAKGLEARYSLDGSSPPRVAATHSLELDLGAVAPVPAPFEIELVGALTAPAYGEYRFGLEGPAGAALEIDDARIVGIGEPGMVRLARGNHRLRVTARVEGPARLAVRWAPPGSTRLLPIPSEALSRGPLAVRGLLGEYRHGADWSGPVQSAQVDRHLQRRLHFLPLPRPYSVEWSGHLDAPTPGAYRFQTDAVGRASLWIDGKPLVSDQAGQSGQATVQLEAGLHSIRVQFVDQSQFSRLDVFWTPPGGQRQPIPARALIPPGLGQEQAAPPAPPVAARALPALGETTLRWQTGGIAEPRGVGISEDGVIYVADPGSRQIHQLASDGRLSRSWSHSDLAEPVDVAMGGDGRPWVLDAEHGWLIRFDLDGTPTTRLAGPSLALYRPRGLGIGPDGSFYIADTGGNRVLKLSSDGAVVGTFGPATGGPAQIHQPTDVAVDAAGDMYVANGEQHQVVRLDPAGRYLTSWAIAAADTVRGAHVSLGPDGAVYVSEPREGRVLRHSPDGRPAGRVEAGPRGGLFHTPVGLAIGADGTLVVADAGLPAVVAVEP